MDESFLKKITILYVEDDELISRELSSTIEKLFKKIIVAENGKDALEKYNQYKDEINLIVSDILMPVMNGIDFLKNIRKENLTIPFIFTTAYTDKEYLTESLKEGVNDYFIKPLNIRELLKKIEKVAKKSEQERIINHYQHETKEYFDTINKVAIVFIFDTDGKLTYINEFFKELSKYEDLDVLGEKYETIYHSDISKDIINKQFDELMNGNKWKGNLKYTTKDNSLFYTNSTILPISDDSDETRFISINFLTTKEENQRREFKKKVLYNFQETKKIFRIAQDKIDLLNLELLKYKGHEKKEEKLLNLRIKNNEYLKNIEEVEERIKKIKKRQDLFTYEVNTKIKQISQGTLEMVDYNEKSAKKIAKINQEIKIREHFIEKLNAEIKEKNQKITDLEDVLVHRDSQLSDKKG